MIIYLLLLLFSRTFCDVPNFQELSLNGPYTKWVTKGNLTAELFSVVTQTSPPAILVSAHVENPKRNPLTVTVIRGKTIQSFAIPRIKTHYGKKFEYWFVSDTLCDGLDQNLNQSIIISVSSSLPSSFKIQVKSFQSFIAKSEPFEVQSGPSEPSFYLYNFPDVVDKVEVKAFSESRICARLITRSANCPLFDGSGQLEMSDVYFYQTFTKIAVFSLRKTDIGPQFHIAVTVDPDDTSCGATNFYSSNQTDRLKTITVSVTPVFDNTIFSLIPFSIYLISMAFVLLITYLKYRWLDRYENNEPSIFMGSNSEGTVKIDKIFLFDDENKIVSHYEYQKQRVVKDIKYFKSLFFQIFGSILPALTILFQNRMTTSSNLDTCYLNYLCTQYIFNFISFNTMSSSISMAVIGFLNLLIVFRKKIFRYGIPRLPSTHGIQNRDAPKVVFCLGLIAEGIPRMIIYNYNYAGAWVNYSVIFWIYSKRHGVRKWQQFYIIAASSIFGCFTLAESEIKDSNFAMLVLKILFLITGISLTGFFCYQYYYERPSGLQEHQWINPPFSKSPENVSDENGVYKPLKSKIFFIIISITLSSLCSSAPLIIPTLSISSIINYYVQTQLFFYWFYYYIQKIRFERSSFTVFYSVYTVFLTFSIVFLTVVNRCLGAYHNTFKTSITPARSREFNKECVLPGIDWNHIRHYNGALIWFMYLLLMDYIDSNIRGAPKKNIFVF